MTRPESHEAQSQDRRFGLVYWKWIVALAAVVLLPGCMGLGWNRPEMDFGERLQPNITKSVLVARINENVARVQSWRSTDVKIDVQGVPVDLSAQIAVEWPRNFRLRATSMRGEEADIGSNNERLWFWMREGGRPEVVTVRHEDVGRVRLPIPFQPDWLMEVMGVVQFDESRMTLQPLNSNGTMSLISEGLSPSGQTVMRIIDVDPKFGLILGHRLYDAGGRPIATAVLDQHQRDPVSQAILPHRIRIDWPQARTAMTLRIRRIEVNPSSLPEPLWQIPTTYPHLDLSRQLPPLEPAPAHQPLTRTLDAAVGPSVATAPFEEPPWDQSAVASVAPVQPSSWEEPAGRARVTFDTAPTALQQQSWRPAADARRERPRHLGAF